MNKKDKINRMTSDEEDVIFIGETRVPNSDTQSSSKEQNDSEKEETKENIVALSKIVMRNASKETFMYIKKRIKISAHRVVTAKSNCSSGSDVKSLDQSLNKRQNTCIMCGEMFESYADIKVHLIQAHSYHKQSQCDICGELFSDQKPLEIHKQVHTEAAITTSSKYLHSALLCELDRHSVDVTKVNTVKSMQEKPPKSEVNVENVNKETKGGLENVNKSAEKGSYVYKNKENNTCTVTKIKLSLPFDKLYICKICKKFVFKSYKKIHEKIHSSKSACSQSSSTERCKIFGPVQVHHAVNKNIGDSAKGTIQDNTVLKQTCQENETRSVDNISIENMATALPRIDAVRGTTNMETQSSLLHAKTLEAVSVNQVNLGESSSLTKRSEKMSLVSVATQNMPPCKQYEERKTILLNNISNGIVTSAHLNISAAKQSQIVLRAIPPQTKSNLPVSCMSRTTKVLASTCQKESASQPTVLPIPLSQSNVALSVHDGSVHKPVTSVVAVLKPVTSVVAVLNGNAALTLPGASGTSASVSFLALPRGVLASASQVANGSNLSFIHLAPPSEKATVPEANLIIPSLSHPALSNKDVSSQAEAEVKAVVKANTEDPHLSSSEVGNVAKPLENIKSSKSLTKIKIYSCPICKKGLSKGYVMQHMMRMHLGERPFKCEICPKAFLKKSSLTKHIAVKHVVKTGVANSENTVSFSGSNDLTVKGSGVCDDLNTQCRIAEQNEHKTKAMVSSIPASNHLDANTDCKNAVGDHETSYYDQSVSGCPESSNRTNEFEVVDDGIQTVNTEICENNEREEITTSCGRKSSLGDVNDLLNKVNDVESNIQEVDMEIIEEFQVLSVDNYNKNVGQKRKLSDASLERPKQKKCNQRRVHTTKLHKERLKRICKLCNVIFYDKRYYRIHMRSKHSKHVSSRANVQCHQCGKLFMYFRSLKQHIMLKHPKK